MEIQTTREHLIEVGVQHIRSAGYTATGVKEILDLAGVPKGSFYHYFPSKEAFAQEVLLHYAAGEVRRWESIFSDRRLAPLKRLRKYFEALIAVYGQSGSIGGCLIGNLSLEIADHSPKLQPILSTAFGIWQQAIAAILREAVQQNDLPKSTKPDDLAAFILNGWEGALVRMKAEKSNNKSLDVFMYFVFNVLLKK